MKEIGPRVLSKYMRKKLDERRRQKEMMGEDAGDVEEEYFLSKLKRKKLKREKSNRSSSAGLVTSSIVLGWFFKIQDQCKNKTVWFLHGVIGTTNICVNCFDSVLGPLCLT